MNVKHWNNCLCYDLEAGVKKESTPQVERKRDLPARRVLSNRTRKFSLSLSKQHGEDQNLNL